MHVFVYSFNFNNVQYICFSHLHAESTLFLTYKFRFKQCISITDTVLKKHWGCKLGSLRLVMLIEKVPGFLNVWLTSCGQKLDYRPITRALVLQLNVRAAVIGWCHLSCPEEVSHCKIWSLAPSLLFCPCVHDINNNLLKGRPVIQHTLFSDNQNWLIDFYLQIFLGASGPQCLLIESFACHLQKKRIPTCW
jgi:hypothetical protein